VPTITYGPQHHKCECTSDRIVGLNACFYLNFNNFHSHFYRLCIICVYSIYQSINQSVNQWIYIQRHKFIASYGKIQRRRVAMVYQRRCPLSRRKNWGCDDASLTTDGKLFQTVGTEMWKARSAVAVLLDGTVSRTEFDVRRKQTGWSNMFRTKFRHHLINN